jgi:hypothetical protein
MLILVSGATPTVRKHFGHPNLGQLLTPHDGGKNLPGMSFAADNAAYSDWDETAFIRMLDRLKGTNPLFVTAPDYVGSARITNELFYQWAPEMEKRNLPIGYTPEEREQHIKRLLASVHYLREIITTLGYTEQEEYEKGFSLNRTTWETLYSEVINRQNFELGRIMREKYGEF